MAEGVRYIKVAKVDGNGTNNTNALQSLTKLTIPYSSGNITYDILNISEEQDYFLYYVNGPSGSFNDAGNIKYDFTGSLNSTTNFSSINLNMRSIIPFITGSVDNNGFYNESDFTYKLGTYPQKKIHIRLSGSISSSGTSYLGL